MYCNTYIIYMYIFLKGIKEYIYICINQDFLCTHACAYAYIHLHRDEIYIQLIQFKLFKIFQYVF